VATIKAKRTGNGRFFTYQVGRARRCLTPGCRFGGMLEFITTTHACERALERLR
jgi:hypothetical protein